MCDILEVCCGCLFKMCDGCCVKTNGCSDCGSCGCGHSGEHYGSGQSSGQKDQKDDSAPRTARWDQPRGTTSIPTAIPIRVMNRDVNLQF